MNALILDYSGLAMLDKPPQRLQNADSLSTRIAEICTACRFFCATISPRPSENIGRAVKLWRVCGIGNDRAGLYAGESTRPLMGILKSQTV